MKIFLSTRFKIRKLTSSESGFLDHNLLRIHPESESNRNQTRIPVTNLISELQTG